MSWVWSDDLVAVLKDDERERARSRPVPLVGYRVEDGTDLGDLAENVILGRDEGRMDSSESES